MALARGEMALMAYNGAVDGRLRFYFYGNSGSDDVTVANYFDDMADQLGVGDLIYDVSGGGMYRVTDITSGVVTVAGNYTVT